MEPRSWLKMAQSTRDTVSSTLVNPGLNWSVISRKGGPVDGRNGHRKWRSFYLVSQERSDRKFCPPSQHITTKSLHTYELHPKLHKKASPTINSIVDGSGADGAGIKAAIISRNCYAVANAARLAPVFSLSKKGHCWGFLPRLWRRPLRWKRRGEARRWDVGFWVDGQCWKVQSCRTFSINSEFPSLSHSRGFFTYDMS